MLSIAIVEPSTDYAFVLADHLEKTNNYQVAIYTSADDALQGLQENPADIAIIDVALQDREGIELIRDLKVTDMHIRCMVLTMLQDDRTVFDSVKAGADGYILKDAALEKIADALCEMEKGGAPMSAFISKKLLSRFKQQAKKSSLQGQLSKKEEEILWQVANGYLYKEIAGRLGVQRDTINKHMQSIFAKLKVHNRTEALNKFFGQ